MNKYPFSFLLLFFLILQVGHVMAEVRLPQLVSDGMVLQRDTKLKIWGWADMDESVKVKFKGKSYKTKADGQGKWSILLSASKAGGPYTMEVRGENNTITLNNILIGDVWLCSGQSNMVHYLGTHQDRYRREIAEADYSEIRQFFVPTLPVFSGPEDDIPEGEWKEANPENVLRFSVVAYFFAKKLYDKYKIPIGLINSSVGGSPIQAWISEEGLKGFDDYLEIVEQNKDTAYFNRTNRAAQEYQQQMAKEMPKDKGMEGEKKWFNVDYQPKNWSRMNIPGYWEDQGVSNLDGVVWFRREVEIPASMVGEPGRVDLGRIVDADQLYINGKEVGSTGYMYPQRRYNIEPGVLKPGKNIFVIRVTNNFGKGGFVPDKPYHVLVESDTIDLKGYWQYKVGAVYEHKTFDGPRAIVTRSQPVGFYNGMLAPFTNYAIKGILWYQGESNAGKPDEYLSLQKALIRDMRNHFHGENLPFLYVQLPNFMDVNYLPSESNWAELREAQMQSLSVPHTAMAVAIDLGEWNDIHPDRKKPVGDRLALAAEHLVYGDKNVVYSGPIYKSATVDNEKVILNFDHVGSGLVSNDGEELRWFAIAGEDKQFVWARAEIKANTVVVWSDKVPEPKYVRYAWADNPDKVNFYNKEGLPASPFRTGELK
ncbi:sialate O-acetylesterase [Fulvivirga sediminis]|uniref:Sialate O-acetylesterase n=1 Tax=Fulvivirga sediminis TaxID=2803949 RepID=A0A937FDU6_9BACT|nr:sialate O-acetylesterase [Fulvivirga sediminis]MBL3658939.1 sialate O-acetylesterase [Fulvivirga sediminis]